MERVANAKWTGDLKSGGGSVKLGSGSFEGKYSFGTRFEMAPGTNPEELLGAAHAACYAMALSAGLAKAGKSPKSVDTTATVKLEKVGEGFSITGIHLDVKADIPGIAAAEFQKFAEDTRKNCIVSRALASVPTTMKAVLL
jgi:osmotically inducible protein OsmC